MFSIKTLWILAGLSILISFFYDLELVRTSGNIDLRNRIVGSRLLFAGVNPYRYHWRPTDPEAWNDPLGNPLKPFSRTTVTPTMLVMYEPLALLPYRATQFVWLILEWIFLLGSGFICARFCSGTRQRLLLVFFLAGISFTNAWRAHTDRGQYYVLMLFLVSAWLACVLRSDKKRALLAGLLAGVLISIRPQFLILVPFLFLHYREHIRFLVASLSLLVILPMCISRTCWVDYFSAMKEISVYYSNGDLSPVEQKEAPQIEGMPSTLMETSNPIAMSDFTLYHLLRKTGFPRFSPFILTLLLGCAYLGWLAMTLHTATVIRLMGMVGWFFWSDVFGIATRGSYQDILIFAIVGFSLAETRLLAAALLAFIYLPVGWLLGVIPTFPGLPCFGTCLLAASALATILPTYSLRWDDILRRWFLPTPSRETPAVQGTS